MRNFILLLGRLTADPKAKTSKSGKAVTTFSLAIDGGKEENGESKVTFIDCESWENLAVACAKYFHKGDLVQARWSIASTWTKQTLREMIMECGLMVLNF